MGGNREGVARFAGMLVKNRPGVEIYAEWRRFQLAIFRQTVLYS